MIRRCYSELYQSTRPSYKGVTVQESWKKFSNFKRDVESLPFGDFCESHGYEMDKDILADGTRMYKLETVCFVPKEINSALIKEVGVNGYKGYYVNAQGYYAPSTKGKVDVIRKKLGYKTSYRSVEEAVKVYETCKSEYLKHLAEKWKGKIEQRVYDNLINYRLSI